jgi:hypothetical protein
MEHLVGFTQNFFASMYHRSRLAHKIAVSDFGFVYRDWLLLVSRDLYEVHWADGHIVKLL